MVEPERPVHYEHPFVTPLELRVPARRFRGRLAAPVTIWTAGEPGSEVGLTVSSVLVAEGDPPLLMGLISSTSDLWDAVQQSGAFVVHILEEGDEVLAERFAGLRPSPGGVFADLDFKASEWGPVLTGISNRAACRFAGAEDAGYQLLVRGEIADFVFDELTDPLVYFRGRFSRGGSQEQ
jgi:3-hydroxy-9,10-secoandrosta-1,3,5(10)-triene-9,17-dione monooxygenase reductase component